MPQTKSIRRAGHSDVIDVPADNPEGTMERFNDGLRRVLAAPKVAPKVTRWKRKKR